MKAFTASGDRVLYWNHQTSWNHSKYFFLSLFFLSVCLHALKGVWLMIRAYLSTIWMTLALNITQEKNRSASYNSLEIVAFWEYINFTWQSVLDFWFSRTVCNTDELLYVHHTVDLTFRSHNNIFPP